MSRTAWTVAVAGCVAVTAAPCYGDSDVKPGTDHYTVLVTKPQFGNHSSSVSHGKLQGAQPVVHQIRCVDGNCLRNPNFACPDPGERFVIRYVWDEAQQRWVTVRRECLTPGENSQRVTPDMVLSELRRVGLPALSVHTNPEDKTLVNLETVFYTEPSPVARTLTLLGQRVLVEATPASYRWHFGDGVVQATDDPGAPYPAMDLTHRYAHARVTMRPSVDTTYTARFRVEGGAWQNVNGTVTIAGTPTDLRVAEATPVLSGNR